MLNITLKSADEGFEEKAKLKIINPHISCSVIDVPTDAFSAEKAAINNKSGAKAIGIALKNLIFEKLTEPKTNPPPSFFGINEKELGLPNDIKPIIK